MEQLEDRQGREGGGGHGIGKYRKWKNITSLDRAGLLSAAPTMTYSTLAKMDLILKLQSNNAYTVCCLSICAAASWYSPAFCLTKNVICSYCKCAYTETYKLFFRSMTCMFLCKWFIFVTVMCVCMSITMHKLHGKFLSLTNFNMSPSCMKLKYMYSKKGKSNVFIVKQSMLTIVLSVAHWMNGLSWSEMPRWADTSLSWFSCHSPKWAAKSIVTRGRHSSVSLEGLLGNKNHQNKVRWSMKFYDINLLFLV